jgi:hypothetical protein
MGNQGLGLSKITFHFEALRSKQVHRNPCFLLISTLKGCYQESFKAEIYRC